MATKCREVEEYRPLSADRLIVGKQIPFDVFVKGAESVKPLFSKGMTFTSYARDILAEKGCGNVLIQTASVPALDNYLSENKKEPATPFNESKAFRDYSYNKDAHHHVDKAFFIPGRSINFSLYVLNKMEFEHIVEASAKSPAMIGEGIIDVEGDLLIKKSDVPLYLAYLQSMVEGDGVSAEELPTIRAKASKEKLKVIVKDVLDDPHSTEKIRAVKTFVGNIVECISNKSDVIYDLISLRNFDYYTYIHSVNVAVLSIGLGKAAGLETGAVRDLGIGAILHDIGKSAISPAVLNKPSLDYAESSLYRSHVMEGEKLVRMHRDIPGEAVLPVVQHHEKLTGKGYPYGLAGKDISLSGRIVSIANFYDDLTTPRPYKYSLTPYYALLFIGKEQRDFDTDLLKTFIRMLGKIR